MPKLKSKIPVHASPAPTTVRVVRIQGGYDAARTTDENRRHWAYADALSPNATASPGARRTLRIRSRYEVTNNSDAKGIGDTICNDAVGRGPQVNLNTGDPDRDSRIEKRFSDWAKEIGLARKLRSMRFARYHTGEAFAVIVTNPKLVLPVKLDLQLFEADQVDDPAMGMVPLRNNEVEGITYDELGNPISYRVLTTHPGSMTFMALPTDFKEIPARFMLHYFREDRPGQRRGVPDITPALPIFAELRRYCAAVIAAAETAADFAAIFTNPGPADPDAVEVDETGKPVETSTLTPFDLHEIPKRAGLTLPEGWTATQMRAEQPTTNYADFRAAKLGEACRCLNVPYTIGALDSSKANMSAAYHDDQCYARAIDIDRAELEALLDRVLDEFLTEGNRIPGFLDAEEVTEFDRKWVWPPVGKHADPAKVAKAQAERLASGTTNLPREYAADGLDWEMEIAAAAKSYGITIEEYQQRLLDATFKTTPAPAGADTPTPEDAANANE